MSFDLNKTIANFAASQLSGIPWAELANTAPEVGGKHKPLYSAEYLEKYMAPAFEAAAKIDKQIDYSEIVWGSEEAQEAYFKMREATDIVKGGLIEAIETNTAVLAYEAAKFDSKMMKLFIASLYVTALNGYIQHLHMLPQRWANQAETLEETEQREQEAMDQATLIVTMFDTIVKLDKFRVLDSLKKGSSTSGLGIAPVLIGAIVVGLVAAVAIIAWAIVSLRDVSQKNLILEKMCVGAKDSTTISSCVKAAAESGPQFKFGDALEPVMKWLVIGGLVVGAVYFAPLIVSKARQAKKAATA